MVVKKKAVKKADSLRVIVYRTQTCPYCHMAEEFLKLNKVKFKSINVGKDTKAAQEMFKKSGQIGVPVIDISGKIIVGFDKGALKKHLNL